MNTSNSPASVVGQRFAKAKREWSDLSHTLLASYAAGFITPALVQHITGNTTVFLNMQHAVQTNPTVTPVFDSMRVNVRTFFYPQRLCMRGMYGNNYMELDEIENASFPVMAYSSAVVNASSHSFVETILPGSLLNRLGYPSAILGRSFMPLQRENSFMNDYGYFNNNVDSDLVTTSVTRTFNLTPIVAYYDICARYLSNPYDPEIPALTHFTELTLQLDNPGGTNPVYSVDTFVNEDDGIEFHNLYDVRDWLLKVKGIATLPGANTIPTQISLFSKVAANVNYNVIRNGLTGPLGPLTQKVATTNFAAGLTYAHISDVLKNKSYQLGLWPSLYMDDISSTYFDTEEIENLMAIDLGSDVESYRLGKSLWNKMFRSILRGKKLDDWVEIQFGSRLKTADHPILVGVDHFNITFSDVLNQSTSGQSADATTNIPLGSASSRGNKGSGNQRRITFTATEPGILMVLVDLVPYVSYNTALPSWLDWKTYADYPLPAFAGRNFSDLKAGDIVFSGDETLDYGVVGKQPLYYDFMCSRDRVGGIFDTRLLDTYTFKRQHNYSAYIEGDNTYLQQVGTTYVQKSMYDYAFPDWGQNGGENYFIKTQFDLRLLQPIPNDVIKTRI